MGYFWGPAEPYHPLRSPFIPTATHRKTPYIPVILPLGIKIAPYVAKLHKTKSSTEDNYGRV